MISPDDDGRCAFCGRYRVVCSPYGKLCVFFSEWLTRGEVRR